MISDTVKDKITQDLVNGLEPTQIAEKHGVGRTSVYRIKKKMKISTSKLVAGDVQLRTAKKQLQDQKKRYRQALDQIAELNKELNQYQQLSKLSSIIIPEHWKVEQEEAKEVVAFALSSDWHIDEIVVPEEIGFINKYNPEIGKKRIETYFKVVVNLLDMCRSRSVINRLVLGLLGDAISGWIHEELMEASDMTPPEAVLLAFELYVSGIDFLLKHGDLKEIDIVCCCGNHSRITKKNEVKRAHKKSYEWLMYQFLTKWYAMKGETRVKFKLPEGYFNWITVFDNDIRFHHGNGIRYGGGVGGIHIPLRKAIAQWNKARKADLDIMGHWHTRETSSSYVLNSSVIGYNEFAQHIKADYQPPEQAFFIIHPEFGKTAEFPIVLDKRRN
jgi:hypothetical protein